MHIDLIQPRHTYAPASGSGQIYMPTAILTAAARLLAADVDVTLHDENIKPRSLTSQIVGVNLLGAPYIPEVIRMQAEEPGRQFALGGQVISGLSNTQFSRLFGSNAVNGNIDTQLATALDIDVRALPDVKQTSLIAAYEKIDDETFKEYASREFSFFLSQGCKFACDFCAAVRSTKDPVTGIVSKVQETYRDLAVVETDLQYLVTRARQLGVPELNMYLSNLDVFQTPYMLNEFAAIVRDIRSRNEGFPIKTRALATVDSFLRARDRTKVIEAMIDSGFHTVGFGIDGVTPEVWKAVGKAHNSEDKCLEAIRSARKDFGITPEALMVFGHEGADTPSSLELAYQFTAHMVDEFGATPRPHVAKAVVPGNDGWRKGHEAQVEIMMTYPESLQTLDFTALPSWLTHNNAQFREVVTNAFIKICEISGSTTQYVKPITPDLTEEQIAEVRAFNSGRFDR